MVVVTHPKRFSMFHRVASMVTGGHWLKTAKAGASGADARIAPERVKGEGGKESSLVATRPCADPDGQGCVPGRCAATREEEGLWIWRG
jgi:hypothetical protein